MMLGESLVPRPQSIEYGTGMLAVPVARTIRADPALWPEIAAAAEMSDAVASPDEKGLIDVRIQPDLGPGASTVTVDASGIHAVGGDAAGAFSAVLTAGELLDEVVAGPDAAALPFVTVTMRPAHPWRGFMLDTARWFVEVEEILATIDLLARLRLNVLHLHLTDDQGWRLPVPGWPRLLSEGSVRAGTTTAPRRIDGVEDLRSESDWWPGHAHDGIPHSGSYTPEDIARIVAYAARRHVRIVPEIDLPGHMQAAIAAYPELGVGAPEIPVASRWGLSPHVLAPTPRVEQFLRDVLTSVMDLFPGDTVHVGGDEPATLTWESDPDTRARMRGLGLADTAALRRWFVERAVDVLAERGRTALYWYDGEVLSDRAIAVSWLADDGGRAAALAGSAVIAAPHTETYLDYFPTDPETDRYGCARLLSVDRAHGWSVRPADATPVIRDRFIGGQAQLWTEYAPDRAARDTLILPRLAAIADVLWRGDAAPRTEELRRALDRRPRRR